jgi:ABC-type branched-subunit amino acid transport system substrate-binding protein
LNLYSSFLSAVSRKVDVLYEKIIDVSSNTPVDYNKIVYDLLAAGAPSVLVITQSPTATNLFEAVKNVTAFQSNIQDYLWFGVDGWVVYNNQLVTITPPGTIGTRGSFLATNQTGAFLKLWEQADPTLYIDKDGNRKSVDNRSLFLVDCMLALAHALQLAMNENPFLEGSQFRKQVINKLFESVNFTGVSGIIDFDDFGDTQSQLFEVANLRHATSTTVQTYSKIGKANKADTSRVDFSLAQWPDKSFGIPNQTR